MPQSYHKPLVAPFETAPLVQQYPPPSSQVLGHLRTHCGRASSLSSPLPLSMFRSETQFPCTHEQLLLLQLYSPRPCHALGRDRAMLLETVGVTFVHTCLTSLTWEDPVRRYSSCELPAHEPLDPMRSGRSPYTGHKEALPMTGSPLLVTL